MKVLPIKPFETEPWLLHKHYAKRMPQIMFAFGLYEQEHLIGVITYGIPASPSLCMGICGKEHSEIVLELNRVCLEHNEKNYASFFVAKSLQLLPKPTIVVSYADTAQGHVGYVYQASNFLYTGLSANRTDWAIKGQENKHSKTISGNKTLEEIKQEFGDDFYITERSRKHRYVFFVGSKKQKKELLGKLRYPIESYPKGDSLRYDSGESVPTQAMLFV